MTDSAQHTVKPDRNSIRCADFQDFYDAQLQLARANSFGAMNSVDKIYYLMVCVCMPSLFSTLQKAAELNGIPHADLCRYLVEYPNLFCEIEENIWSTYRYAEKCGFIAQIEPPHAKSTIQTKSDSAEDILRSQNARSVKNGFTCLSLDELTITAHAFCQSSEFRTAHQDNYTMLYQFLLRLPLPVRTADLENVVFSILGFKIAHSTFRKYLSSHPDLFCSPTHGVWCSQKLARETPYTDHRTLNH